MNKITEYIESFITIDNKQINEIMKLQRKLEEDSYQLIGDGVVISMKLCN